MIPVKLWAIAAAVAFVAVLLLGTAYAVLSTSAGSYDNDVDTDVTKAEVVDASTGVAGSVNVPFPTFVQDSGSIRPSSTEGTMKLLLTVNADQTFRMWYLTSNSLNWLMVSGMTLTVYDDKNGTNEL